MPALQAFGERYPDIVLDVHLSDGLVDLRRDQGFSPAGAEERLAMGRGYARLSRCRRGGGDGREPPSEPFARSYSLAIRRRHPLRPEVGLRRRHQ
jgi:hypothetical protein